MRGLETWARYSTLDICNKIYCWWLTNRLEVSSQAKLKDLTIFMFRQPHLSLSLSLTSYEIDMCEHDNGSDR